VFGSRKGCWIPPIAFCCIGEYPTALWPVLSPAQPGVIWFYLPTANVDFLVSVHQKTKIQRKWGKDSSLTDMVVIILTTFNN
jgi:hypothetical protein